MKSQNALLSLLLGALLLGGNPLFPAAPPPADALTLENAELRITWRARDAAVVQVEWKADGTRFFPERNEAGPRFGLGGATSGRFEGPPRVAAAPGGREITFAGAGGERVVYLLPPGGHVLGLVQASVPLALLPVPADLVQATRLGRVFTLEDRRVHAVSWVDILKEPFCGFLGARRKEPPPSAPRLGMDAGAGHFAAIWEVNAAPLLGPGGYLLPPAGSGRLYLGPKHGASLAAFGKAFPQVLDFGVFGPLGRAMYLGLGLLHAFCPNWGWSLVLFSVLLRTLLWPLNTKSILQGLRGRDLDPHVKAIQARSKDAGDTLAARAEAQKELMAFYRRNGHSPMGGCLSALVQMPVFLALYGMLGNVFELRHAPWIFWIRDLSGKDPFYVLPVLLCLGMFAQQALAPPVGDPAQRRMMLILVPAMMLFMFANLPAGLNLYYLAFNLAGMVQTWWVTRTYRPRPVVA